MPAFAFLLPTGTHLPRKDGRLRAWMAGYVVRQLACLKTVTHPTTNRAQCRATVLIETSVLPLH